MTSRLHRPPVVLALVAGAAALAYAPSFVVPFQFDDYARILDNAPLQAGQWRAALGWLGAARVLPSLTLVANYVIGGDRVLGYHVVNFALHLIAAGGVYALARLLCRAPRLRGSIAARASLLIAGVAALIMACHPLQTQAVTYIIQRAAVMATLFYVWAVACYVRGRLAQSGAASGRPSAWFVATAVLGGCALLSKENAASLPLALLLVELTVLGGRLTARTLAIGAAVAVLLLSVPLGWKIATWQPFPGTPLPDGWLGRAWMAILDQGTEPSAMTPYTYLLTELTVIPAYLRLIVLPWGLNVDPDVPVASAWTGPVVGGLLLLAALIAIGVGVARRAPLVAFGLLWIFVALSVESSLLPISDAMMEHRVYLAMPGAAILAGVGIAWLHTRRPRLATALVVALAVALVGLTAARNLVWQSPVSLWLDAAEKSPRKARVLMNYGVALHSVGAFDAAARLYCRALVLDPTRTLAADNLELALGELGKLDDIPATAAGPHVGRDGGDVVVEIDIPRTFCPGLLAGS